MAELTQSDDPQRESNIAINPLIDAITSASVVPILDEYMQGIRKFTVQDEGLMFTCSVSDTGNRFFEFFGKDKNVEATNNMGKENIPPLLYVYDLTVKGEHSGIKAKFPQIKTFTAPLPLRLSYASTYTPDSLVIPGNMLSGAGIVVVGHELGHLVSFRNIFFSKKSVLRTEDEARDKLKNRMPLTPDEATTVLNEERRAWAACLQMLRPFIRSNEHSLLTHDNIKQFIHEYALQSYSESIAGLLIKSLDI